MNAFTKYIDGNISRVQQNWDYYSVGFRCYNILSSRLVEAQGLVSLTIHSEAFISYCNARSVNGY
jgi:hypothetical protein